MDVNKTSLSAGELIRAVLTENADVAARTANVFPVVEDQAYLPYIVYRRSGLERAPVKSPHRNDTVTIEVQCYATGYTEGVELAEAVRSALDGVQIEHEGMVMRSCDLADSEEAWADDAYVQTLIFECKL
ncbi:MAG: DUF3168 domain-containing protein [Muribaculaceae bacterium]|nr:DUF3168 domain-containing protein [Muribaculaceae bacterium]